MPTPFLCVDKIGTRTDYTLVDGSNPLPMNRTSDYPMSAVPIGASSGNVAATAAVATLAAVPGKTMFITGFEVTSAGATVAAVVTVTIVGAVGGTMAYTYIAAAGATLSNTNLIVQFTRAIPATAVNIPIVVTLPSLGIGNTNATVVCHGYYM